MIESSIGLPLCIVVGTCVKGTLQHVQHPDLLPRLGEVRLVEAVLGEAEQINQMVPGKLYYESQPGVYNQLKFLTVLFLFSQEKFDRIYLLLG